MSINNEMEKYSLLYTYSEISFNELFLYATGMNLTDIIRNKISQAQIIHTVTLHLCNIENIQISQ